MRRSSSDMPANARIVGTRSRWEPTASDLFTPGRRGSAITNGTLTDSWNATLPFWRRWSRATLLAVIRGDDDRVVRLTACFQLIQHRSDVAVHVEMRLRS